MFADPKKKLLRLASRDIVDADVLYEIASKVEEERGLTPFAKPKEIEKRVCEWAVERFKISPSEISQVYDIAANDVVHFARVGEKLSQSDAILDALIDQAKNHLMEDIYDRNGEVIGQRFSSTVMGAITNAINSKMGTLTKLQQNALAKERLDKEDEHFEEELNLRKADLGELRATLKGGLVQHPEIAKLLIERAKARKNDL